MNSPEMHAVRKKLYVCGSRGTRSCRSNSNGGVGASQLEQRLHRARRPGGTHQSTRASCSRRADVDLTTEPIEHAVRAVVSEHLHEVSSPTHSCKNLTTSCRPWRNTSTTFTTTLMIISGPRHMAGTSHSDVMVYRSTANTFYQISNDFRTQPLGQPVSNISTETTCTPVSEEPEINDSTSRRPVDTTCAPKASSRTRPMCLRVSDPPSRSTYPPSPGQWPHEFRNLMGALVQQVPNIEETGLKTQMNKK